MTTNREICSNSWNLTKIDAEPNISEKTDFFLGIKIYIENENFKFTPGLNTGTGFREFLPIDGLPMESSSSLVYVITVDETHYYMAMAHIKPIWCMPMGLIPINIIRIATHTQFNVDRINKNAYAMQNE